MKFSLSIAPFFERGARDPYRRTFELCRLAEDLGFETAMIGHHHFVSHLPSDPFALLSAIAARTTTLRLATAIFQLAIHHPLRVAEQVAMLDQLSGGRAALGVGLGWDTKEYAAFGADFRHRGARLEEALVIVRAALSQPTVSHNGGFWSFPEVALQPQPVQQPAPPVWVAGLAPAAIDRAARLGDGWICDPVQTVPQVAQLRATYVDACMRADRTPEWMLRRYVWLGSRDDLEAHWLPAFVRSQLAYWRVATEGPEERRLFARIDAGEDVSPREVAADRFLGGPPGDVVEQIDQVVEATGCDHISIGFGGGMSGRATDLRSADDYEEMRAMVEQFGREVIPACA